MMPAVTWNLFAHTDSAPPRLVRLSEAAIARGVLRAYECAEGFEWPTASHASPAGLCEHRIGFHPTSGELATGRLRRSLTPNLFVVTFQTNELYLAADEFVDCERATAILAASAVRLRPGISPAFGLGGEYDDDERPSIVGVLRFDNRARASPVAEDGTVALLRAGEAYQCNLRFFLEELEPLPADDRAPAPSAFATGDAVRIRGDARHLYGDMSSIVDYARPGIVVGVRAGSTMVNFPESPTPVGIGDLSLERAWKPPVGTRVRVVAERPAAQPTRPNCMWAHAPSSAGAVVGVSHDGVVFAEFNDAQPRVQAYFLNEVARAMPEAADADDLRPDDVVCPLTLAPFKHPVVAADGFSYEQTAWEALCASAPGEVFVTSPMTRETISSHAYTNRALRKLLETQQQQQQQQQQRARDTASSE